MAGIRTDEPGEESKPEVSGTPGGPRSDDNVPEGSEERISELLSLPFDLPLQEAADTVSQSPLSESPDKGEVGEPSKPAFSSEASPPTTHDLTPEDTVSEETAEVSMLVEPTTKEDDIWCVVGNSLEPRLLMDAFRRRISSSASVTLEYSDAALGVIPKPFPASVLTKELPSYLLDLFILGPIRVFLGFFVFLMSGVSIATSLFSPLNLPIAFWNFGVTAWNLLIEVINLPLTFIQVVKLTLAIVRKEDWVNIPHGMHCDEDGFIARLSRADRIQIMRFDVTESFLKKHAKEKKGCIAGLLSLVLLPINILLWMFARNPKKQVSMFAFVAGEPMDLTEATGFMARRKKRKAERKLSGDRDVYLISISPAKANDVQETIEHIMQQEVIVLEEKSIPAKLWL